MFKNNNRETDIGFFSGRGGGKTNLRGMKLRSATIQTGTKVDNPERFFVVIAPIMAGKTTFCKWQGGLDVDQIVYGEDDEYRWMVEQREELLHKGGDWTSHNDTMARRLTTALNAVKFHRKKILFLHSAELAFSVGLSVNLIWLPETDEAWREGDRWDEYKESGGADTWEVFIQGNIASILNEIEKYNLDDIYATYETREEWQVQTIQYAEAAGVVSPLPYWQDAPTMDIVDGVPKWILTGSIPEGGFTDFYQAIKEIEMYFQKGLIHGETAAIWLSTMWRVALPVELAQYVDYEEWCSLVNTITYYVGYANIPRPYKNMSIEDIFNMSEDRIKDTFKCYGEGAKMPVRIYDLVQSDKIRNQILNNEWRRGILDDKLKADSILEEQMWVCTILYLCSVEEDELLETLFDTRVLSVPYDKYIAILKDVHNQTRINGTFFGTKLSDADYSKSLYLYCLYGRKAGQVDVESEIMKRTTPLPEKMYQDMSGAYSKERFDEKLVEKVDYYYKVFIDNIGKAYKMLGDNPNLETFMYRANRWMANGALGFKYKEAVSSIFKIGAHAYVQLRKKAAFEMKGLIEYLLDIVERIKKASDDGIELEYGSETSIVTKNEIAALRALYPANIMHYMLFSYILFVVEKCGQLEHSTLGGGSETFVLVTCNLRDAAKTVNDSICYFMGDFADFNNTHSIKHMKMVITELKDVFRKTSTLDPDMKFCFDFIIKAFDGIALRDEKKLIVFNHGLLSGWRGTTFINSVLNNAYIAVLEDMAIELGLTTGFRTRDSGGDDIANTLHCWADCVIMIILADILNYEFNFIKQLFSYRFGEFFRLVITDKGVYGSFARAIAAYVSGNWLSISSSDPVAKMDEMVANIDKLERRQCGETVADFLHEHVINKWGKVRTDRGFERINPLILHGAKEDGGLGVPTREGEIYRITPIHKLGEAGMADMVDNIDATTISQITAEEDYSALNEMGLNVQSDMILTVAKSLAVSNFISSIQNAGEKETDEILTARCAYFSQTPERIGFLEEVELEPVPHDEFIHFMRIKPEYHLEAMNVKRRYESLKNSASLFGVGEEFESLMLDTLPVAMRYYLIDERLYGKYCGSVSDSYGSLINEFAKYKCATEAKPLDCTDAAYLNGMKIAIVEGILAQYEDEFMN